MAVCVLVVILLRLSIGLVEAKGTSKISLLGEDVTLSCSPPPSQSFPSTLTDVDCLNTYSIIWRKTDTEEVITDISQCLDFYSNYYNTDRVTVDYLGNKYNLHISNVQPSDKGRYECLTAYTSTEIALTVQLNIYEHSCSAPSQAIEIGDHVSLKCSLQILRALQWVAPNGTVLASRRDESNQQLVFNFTTREEHNFEKYTCVAISESGAYNPNCSVTPLEYKFITISPLVSRVKQGDNVSFICNARLGARAPHRYDYTWLQDDNIVLQGLNMSSYTIHDLQLPDNGARVQCKACNDGKDEMASSEAIIYVSATMTTSNPDDACRTRNDGDSVTSKRTENIPPRKDSSNIVGVIAGCIGGTVLLLIISVILVIFIKKNKTRKSTDEVEAATTLTRDHDSTSGTSKGRDPSKASTPDVTNQSSSATNENDAVYALPQQKGGGHTTVTTQAVSGERLPTASTASGGQVQSGIAATSKASTPSVTNQSSSATNEIDAVYALPQQKGGGHTTASPDSGGHVAAGQSGIAATTDDVDATYAEPFKKQDDGITYGNVTDSRELVKSQEPKPNVEGLLYAELEIANSNANDGQIIHTSEATLYAAIQQVQ